MKVRESAENYLETIYILGLDGTRVRSIDVANELNYSKPSVSVAIKNLKNSDYVEIGEDGAIALTKSGRAVAARMYERHIRISDWLVSLGVDKKTADSDACKMEHTMSERSFRAIKRHIAGRDEK